MTPGALHFESTLGTRNFRDGINTIERDIKKVSTTAQKEAGVMDGTFQKLGLAIGGYFGTQTLISFTQKLIEVRGEFQKTEIAFTTMLGNGQKAKELMSQMVDLAAKTPFSLQEVSTGAKQLLAFQVPANEIVDTLTRMGNIAAGLGVPLARLNLVYGQVKAKGRLQGDDLRQFTEAGIPMINELGKSLGKTNTEILKMVTEGKIGFKDVQNVLFNLTTEGGMFFNLMEKQSVSLSGKVSNLGDTIDQVFNELGTNSEGLLGNSIDALNYLVENYDSLVEILVITIATYGVYKAALVANLLWTQLNERALIQQALSQNVLTLSQARGAAATIMLQGATRGLSAALMANPIGIVIGLLAGLSYVIYKNVTASNAYLDLQEKLKKSSLEYAGSVDEVKAKMGSLISIIKNKKTTDDQAKKALNQINQLTGNRIKGLSLEAIRLGKSSEAIKNYIGMLQLEARAKALIATKEDAEKRKREILSQNPKDLSFGDYFSNIKKGDIGGGLDLLYGPEVQKRKRRAMVEDISGILKIQQEADKELNDLMAKGVNVMGAFDSSAVPDEINSETEKVKKARFKKDKEIEKIYGIDTLKGLQQRISKLNDIIETTSFSDVKYPDLINKRDALQKNLEEEQKKRQKKSFDENMAETKRQIEIRDKLIQSGYSKESVDEMFPEIKDKSYLDYLGKTSFELRKLMTSGEGGEETAENLFKIQEAISQFKDQKTYIEGFIQDIEKLKKSFSGFELIEKIQKLGTISLMTRTGEEDQQVENEIKKAIEAEELLMQEKYRNFLDNHKSFEDQKTEITRQFNEIRTQIENDDKLSPEQKTNAFKAANEAEGQALSSAFLEGMKKNPEWAKAFEDMGNVTLKQLKRLRSVLSLELKNIIESGKGTPEQLKALSDIIKDIDATILTRNPFQALAESIRNIGNEADTTKSKLEKIKDVAKSVASVADLINEGISTGVGIMQDLGVKFSEETLGIIGDIQTTIGGVSDLASGIASANPAQIIKGIGGIVKGLASLFNGDRKKEKNIKRWAVEVENLKNQYEALQKAVASALGEDTYKQQQQVISNLRQQQQALKNMANEEGGKKKKDEGKINEWNQQINAIDNQINDLFKNMAEQIAQTNAKDLASQLADSLIEAYGKGEDAAEAYGKVADDVMKNAVKNALKMQLLEGPMQEMIKQLIKNMGFNADGTGTFDGLTEAEREQIKALMAQASANFTQALGAYEEFFGEAAAIGNNKALEGSVKTVSEETASIIAGQMNAIRNNQGQMLLLNQESLMIFKNNYAQLVKIEYNTRYLKYIYNTVAGTTINPFKAAGVVFP